MAIPEDSVSEAAISENVMAEVLVPREFLELAVHIRLVDGDLAAVDIVRNGELELLQNR